MFTGIFENYEAFYTMLTSVTIMSNATSDELKHDGEKVVDFIANAYGISDTVVEECKEVIFNKLSSLALITDGQAIYNYIGQNSQFEPDLALWDIKGNILGELHNISKLLNAKIHPFDYSRYHIYQPYVRFSEILTVSASGNVVATRQVGIMKMLGIGCEQNSQEAIARLFQCVVWGDIPSMYMLANCYDILGNEQKSQLFYEIATLCTKYLHAGVTVLPQSVKESFSEEACTYFVYISTILQDVIWAYHQHDIAFSFVEAITSDTLDYFQRMNFINNYDKKEWKNVTNSAIRPTTKIGFR